MEVLEVVVIAIISFILGVSAGYYIKTSLKIILFFLGFYILTTAVLVYLGFLTVNIDFGAVLEYVKSLASGGGGSLPEIDLRYVPFLIPFGIGVIVGFKIK